ncbi:MAG: lipoyl(octanoyl) transferase LipB [Candidatus Eremiobacteraeota bacterium]|nr:lipoyl(octanoyl) transferase LipB [Candidatus Eremiobacteraeota bacterium]MBC5827190.1 lipoyl(octanoyl) transferase LipB [Candidatus Eremiobacteraeota bacterium]
MNVVNFRDLGLIDYAAAWELQRAVHEQRACARTRDTLIFCEHPPVITMGKSGKGANLLVAAAELARRGIEYFEVERGGDLTFHGPGQLIGYPIFKLARLREVQGFVRKMEESIVRALAAFGVRGERRTDHPGVFVCGAKIASIGAAVRRGVTFHGFALDVCTDPLYYRLINPCGMADVSITTLAVQAHADVVVDSVKPHLRDALQDVFQIELRDVVASATDVARCDDGAAIPA